MKGALVILLVTVAFGCLLFYADRRKKQRARTVSDAPEVQAPAPVEESEKKPQRPEGCCGLHLVCEKMLPTPEGTPTYFDDEELDRYRGREADSYTPDEVEEFRDVLLTLRQEEVAEWLGALRGRGISLPDLLRDEAFMIIGESSLSRD